MRRPLLLLVLIFLGGFILMRLIRSAISQNSTPPSYDTGSSGGAEGSAPSAPEGPFADARLTVLRQQLNANGYASVQFRPNGDAIELWGTVPSNFDLSRVEMICMSAGFPTLEVHVKVADNDWSG